MHDWTTVLSNLRVVLLEQAHFIPKVISQQVNCLPEAEIGSVVKGVVCVVPPAMKTKDLLLIGVVFSFAKPAMYTGFWKFHAGRKRSNFLQVPLLCCFCLGYCSWQWHVNFLRTTKGNQSPVTLKHQTVLQVSISQGKPHQFIGGLLGGKQCEHGANKIIPVHHILNKEII